MHCWQLNSGACFAIIDDYTNRCLGVPVAAQVAPAFTQPYALAVAKGDDVMYDRCGLLGRGWAASMPCCAPLHGRPLMSRSAPD